MKKTEKPINNTETEQWRSSNN